MCFIKCSDLHTVELYLSEGFNMQKDRHIIEKDSQEYLQQHIILWQQIDIDI